MNTGTISSINIENILSSKSLSVIEWLYVLRDHNNRHSTFTTIISKDIIIIIIIIILF